MSRSVVYKERETDRYTERDYDEQPRKSYTTVKRYQVPESSVRSPVEDETTKEKITIRRERSANPPPREDDYYRSTTTFRETDRDRGGGRGNDDSWDVKITERTRDSDRDNRNYDDYRYSSERVTERDSAPRRDVSYRVVERDDYDDRKSVVRSDYRGGSDHRTDYRTDYRYTERDREVVRAPSPPSQNRETVFRFERERDYSPPERQQSHHYHDDDYEVERYVKETDYYQPQQQPQPIIIRERAAPAPAPIIIREERRDPAPIIIRERREPQYEFIERKEVEEEKQLVKREEPPPPATVAPPPPQQEEDYFYERRVIERERPRSRDHRSEIRPKDSASNYSSDDSYEYVRRERTFVDEDEKDPHHKRNLAAGALAGAAAGEIIRHHRRSEGKNGGGRLSSAAGGALVGGIGAEVLSRARSRRRSRAGSRSRSRSSSRDDRRSRRHKGRDRSRSRSRSRSKSVSRKQLAGLAGVAAVGALAGYALNKRNKQETVIVNERSPPRRSRSRRRRGSPDSYMDSRALSEDDKHRDPEHRNKRIAQAGLASAAAAGIWERVRSKSRGGKGRDRSKSKVRQAVPVVGAGLGGAALAGLWEKNKANKEAKRDRAVEEELGRGRNGRSRSRSRSRSVPDPRRGHRSNVDAPDMVAYGDDPVHSEDRGYYSDDAPGVYNRSRGGGSVGSSPDRRRRSSRSRSRGRGLAEGAAGAGIGAVAAHEIGKRRERRRQEDAYYDDHNNYGPSPGTYSPAPEPPSGYLPPQQNAGYPPQQAGYQAPYFPPPPTGENVYAHNEPYPAQQQQQAAYATYNPADYAQPGPAQQTPYGATRGFYGDSEANLGAPYANDTFAGDSRHAAETPPHDSRGRGREPPENVSAPVNGSNITPNPNNSEQEAQDADGVRTPRARSSSRVRFNLGANEMHSPEAIRRQPAEERFSDTETSGDRKRRHRKRKHRDKGKEPARDSPQLMNDKYERAPNDNDSDVTEDLPERFDEHGNRKPERSDPLEALIGNLASKFLGGGDEDDRGRRHRHRH